MEKAAFVRLEKREEMAALPGELQNFAHDAFEPAGRRRLTWERRDKNALEIVENVEDRVEVQILFGREVPVDRSLADTGLGSHVVNQNVVEVFDREDLSCRSEDLSLFTDCLDSRHIDSGTDRSVSVSHTSPLHRGFRQTQPRERGAAMFGVSDASRSVAGLILVLVPTIEIGGLFLLWMISRRDPGYLANPVRQALFRAG